MKTAVNLTIQVFESRYQKEYLIRFWWLIFSNFTYIRHLVYWKCIIWAKYDLPIINSVCEKVWFTINGLSKMLFLIFAFFIFPNFKWLLSRILWKNHPFLPWISRDLIKFYNVLNIFDLHTLDKETTTLLRTFEISTVSLFFLNERNITTSLLMIHLKYAVVPYANLNSSSMNKPCLRAVEYAFSFFFGILIYVYFNKAFIKNFIKKVPFLIQLFKIHFTIVCILQNNRMSNLAILKWWSFEYKAKFF